MFERFTPASRRTVVAALEVARRHGAEQVEPEHLLLALTAADGDGDAAARAIAEAGLDAGKIEAAMEQDLVAVLEAVGVPASVVAATPAQPRVDNPGFGIAMKAALEQALREAVARDERRIGTEHLLLGLLDTPAVGLARLLERLDVAPWRLAALLQVEMASRR